MANETTLRVVSSLSGNEAPPPPKKEVEAGSNQRMSQIMKTVQRRAGVVVPNSDEKEEKARSENTVGAAEKTPQTSTELENAPHVKAQEKVEKTPDRPKPEETVEYWRQEASKHQSRADKAEHSLKEEFEPKVKKYEDENKELVRYKAMVDDFAKDPVGTMLKFAPNLAKQLQAAGDPIRAIELEVSDYQKSLDEAFLKEFGQDWRFNELEAMRPGTPSFRYKLAIDDRISEIRNRQRNFIDEQNRRAKDAEESIAKDKERLHKEFGFGEEDFTEAEKLLNEQQKVSYYNLVRALLIDKVIKHTVSSLVPAPKPPSSDITDVRGGDNTQNEKKKISERGAQVLARLGRSALAS